MTTATEFKEGRDITLALFREGCHDSSIKEIKRKLNLSKRGWCPKEGPNLNRAYWLGRLKGKKDLAKGIKSI